MKSALLNSLFTCAAICVIADTASADTLAAWDTAGFTYNTSSPTQLSPVIMADGVTLSEFGFTGISEVNSTNAISANGWPTASALNTADDYFSFTLTADPGQELTLASWDYTAHRTSSGSTRLALGYRVDDGSGYGAWVLNDMSTTAVTAVASLRTWDFSDFTTTGTVEFAIWFYRAPNGTAVMNPIGSTAGNDMAINGTVAGGAPSAFPNDGNYYWQAGDGSWSNTANWYVNGSVPASLANNQTVTFGAPPNAVSPATVNLDAIGGSKITVQNGDFTFVLDAASLTAPSFVIGDGMGNTANVRFNAGTGNTITFGDLAVGAHGSSGNYFGNDTFGPGVQWNFASNANILVGTSGSGGNNILDLDGKTLTIASIGVNGYYNDEADQSNNKILVHNSAQLNVGGITVGAGSEFRIETGGKVTSTGVSVAKDGRFILDGAGGSEFSGNISVSGDATLSNGALVSNVSNVTVGSTGHLLLDGVVVESSTGSVSGLMEVQNGSSYSTTTDLGVSGQLVVDGGQVTVGRQFSGNASIQGGGVLTTDRYTGGSGVSVEEGSTFRFETWAGAGELSANGKVTWGAGNDASGTLMKVMAGTTLVLDGGSYKLGRFGLMEGSALEGSGVIDAMMESTSGGVGGPLDGGVQGASINPGTADSVGRLEFTKNVVFFGSTSQITFSILDADNYDQIAGNLLIGNELVIKLELMQPLEDIIASFEAGVTSFQLVSTAAGGPISLSLAGGGLITYDFNGTDEALAAYDLAWDTSNFASTGAIGLVAVPEPSALVLLGLGAMLALGRKRKRSAALAV